jgi:Ni,Fe-hydrogenase III small subunit/formate hydrogenlyase subunit 6/NADH:ubiquinone oxidoreductase subunit I
MSFLAAEIIADRLRNGCQTSAYPDGPSPVLPDRHGGALRLDAAKCDDGCAACVPVCPAQAIAKSSNEISVDIGKCLFCSECVHTCPSGAIMHTGGHSLAARKRADLILGKRAGEDVRLAGALDEKLRRLFGRSLRLRQVSAGGCNACEADTNVLGTVGWDLGRFGIQFVASPRHADGLLITGPISRNMALALEKTYRAVPQPRIVIAVGACAISGGPFSGLPEVRDGALSMVPVDLFIPGCPPHPLTILDGLLRLLGRSRG